MDEKILSKMRKLLAMSQDTSSEKEAMIAAKRLHAMLAKYNVSMTEIERDEFHIGQSTLDNQVNWPWKRRIGRAISKLYFCDFYQVFVRKNYAHYVITGLDHNRIFAESLIKRVFIIIEAEAKVQSFYYHNKLDSNFISSFRNGASSRIVERCEELMEQGKKGELQDDDGDKLPALIGVYEESEIRIQDFYDNNRINLRVKNQRMRAFNRTGYEKGSELGGKIGLNREIQKQNAPLKLGRN